MMMHANRLRHRVTFQRPGNAMDQFGQPVTGDFQDMATVWAEIRPAGSNERLAASQMQSALSHVLTTRHTAALAAATGSWRVLYGQRVFGITGLPRDLGGEGRWLAFDCTERVNG